MTMSDEKLCPVHHSFIVMSGRVQQPHPFPVHHRKARTMLRMGIRAFLLLL
jgi:hypothetical protein